MSVSIMWWPLICLFFLPVSIEAIPVDVYREIYPEIAGPLPDCDQRNASGETCPIFIAFTVSFGGSYKTSGALVGLQIALDEINNDSTILPGYTLHYTLKDSNCDRQTSLSSFYTQMFQPPTKLAIIGSGCSVATEPSAESAPFFNLTQTSCISSSPALSNRAQYKTHFQMLASESFLAYGYFAIVEHFGWRHIAIIIQDETLFTRVMDLTTELLRANNISYTETLFYSSGGVRSLEDRLFDSDARVFLFAMYTAHAREFLCRASQEQKYYPRYQFVTVGWYGDEWWIGDEDTQRRLMEEFHCSVEDREHVMAYILTVLQDEFLTNYSTVIDSGNTGAGFYMDHDARLNRRTDLEPIIYVQQCYDGVWTIARALNKTMTALEGNETLRDWVNQFRQKPLNETFQLHHFTYNNSAMLEMIMENMANTDFLGLTGRVRFNENGVKEIQFITVEQYRVMESGDLQKVKVASVDFSNTSNLIFIFEEGISDTNMWPHGQIPYDGVPNLVEATVEIGVTALFASLATLGIIFTIACLIFNFKFRNTKLMKLSSPNLNYLIATGAIILYVDIYLFIVPTTHPLIVTILCNVNPWFTAIGYSLCYGTVVMKMGRIFYIFNNAMSTKAKRTIHDWTLAIGVAVLVMIDIIILTVYSVIDRENLRAVRIVSAENPQDEDGLLGHIYDYFIFICDSSRRSITISVLYGFKAALQIIALIFAFSIRKVNVKGLDDSPFIIAAIYVSSIVLAIIFVSSITLKDFENAFAGVFCTGFFIGTTVILLLVFVPKMVTLYRDPNGEKIFKAIAPPSEVTKTSSTGNGVARPRERKMSLPVTAEEHGHKFREIVHKVRSSSTLTLSSKQESAAVNGTTKVPEKKKPCNVVLQRHLTLPDVSAYDQSM